MERFLAHQSIRFDAESRVLTRDFEAALRAKIAADIPTGRQEPNAATAKKLAGEFFASFGKVVGGDAATPEDAAPKGWFGKLTGTA